MALNPEKTCASADCGASFPDHYWGKVHASKDGWLMLKDGKSWCPAHLPGWVDAWRQDQRDKRLTIENDTRSTR